MTGLRVRDGSGLSRGNRLTSRSLSVLLWRMAQHPLAAFYQASMAISGRRGTLRDYFNRRSLEGRFWGKTGTLKGVRSISGILETANGQLYVSMIANGSSEPKSVMDKILLASQHISRCPAWTAAGLLPGGRD